MARLVLANAKKADILEGGRPYLDTLEMRLFTANITPTGTVQPVTPTDECDDGGYSPVANPYPNAATASGTRADAVGVNPTFVFDHDAGDQTIYGVFFTDPNDSDATVMSQRDDAPFTVTAAGQVYVVEAHFYFDTMTVD